MTDESDLPSVEDAMRRPNYISGLTRPPTPAQKDYMRRDEFAFSFLEKWATQVFRESILRITFPDPTNVGDACIRAIAEHDDSASQGISLEDKLLVRKVIDKWNEMTRAENADHFISSAFISWLTSSVFNTPIQFSSLVEPFSCHVLFAKDESEDSFIEQSIDLSPISVYTILRESDIISPQAILILTLYLLDMKVNLNNNRGPGHIIPRFLPIYPTKELNRIISTRYATHISLLNAWSVAKPNEFAEMNRAKLTAFAEEFREAIAQKKKKVERFNFDDSEFALKNINLTAPGDSE